MKNVKLTPDERERIHDHLVDKSKRVETVIRSAANVLSDATKYTSVIVAPKLGTLRIKHVQLVPVAERTALMIIVTSAGIVKDAVIRVPEGLDADDLYGISRILTQRLADQPLEGVRQAFADLLRDAEQNRRLLGEALQVIEKRLEAGGDASDVIVGGSANLLEYPEYSDVNKARSFLSVLESKDTLRKLLGREGSMEVSIRIGPENQVPELNDCSIVSASYRVGDHSNGTLGIIGPTRMNYNRVISVLDFMGRALSDVLSEYK
jgi:heat-inducible transcriptional repressor